MRLLKYILTNKKYYDIVSQEHIIRRVVQKLDTNLEALLLEQHSQLYSAVLRKSTDELNIKKSVEDGMIGFGRVSGFYMFWIAERNGSIYFTARIKFKRKHKDNIVRFAFNSDNQNEILDAIDSIYNSYFKKEKQVQNPKFNYPNTKPAVPPKYTSKNPSPTMLAWYDALALINNGDDLTKADNETFLRYTDYSKRFIELASEIINALIEKEYIGNVRNISMYREYMFSDKTTLADVALPYGYSREFIRQTVKKTDKRMLAYFKKAMLYDDVEINQHVMEMISIMQATDYNVIQLLCCGMQENCERKKQAIANMLFGQVLGSSIYENSKVLSEKIREERELRFNDELIHQSFEYYRSKICYPSIITVDSHTEISSYVAEFHYSFEKSFYEKLKKFESIIDIVVNPDVVYYSTKAGDHRPHFLLRLPDGTSVLVLVMQTVNMAFIYNIERCNALHSFCKKHGYGYLITDDHGNSILDIKNRTVDQELTDILNSILNNNGLIVWNDIKAIKQTQSVSNHDISAYVLQNKLHFTLKPFCIKRR